MKNIMVTIARAMDGTFWCQTETDVFGAQLNGSGASVKEAKADLMGCLEDARADSPSNGDTEVAFSYQYDLQSFFDYFSFLNVSEIARRAEINPSLMRQYVSGYKRAGEKTYNRLAACISDISKEMQSASLRG